VGKGRIPAQMGRELDFDDSRIGEELHNRYSDEAGADAE